jgi:hypothetical protein
MEDLIKKYEEFLKIAQVSLETEGNQYKIDALNIDSAIFLQIIEDLKTIQSDSLQNNERLILQRLVKDEIATPRKKLGTSKMNTLYSLEGKLKK